MKSLFVLLAGLCLATTAGTAFAQDASPGAGAAVARAPSPQSRSNAFAGIDLTDAQRARLRALTQSSRNAMRAVASQHGDGRPLSAADRAAMRRIGQQHNDAVLAVLTSSQRDRLEANLAVIRSALERRPTAGRVTDAGARP